MYYYAGSKNRFSLSEIHGVIHCGLGSFFPFKSSWLRLTSCPQFGSQAANQKGEQREPKAPAEGPAYCTEPRPKQAPWPRRKGSWLGEVFFAAAAC